VCLHTIKGCTNLVSHQRVSEIEFRKGRQVALVVVAVDLLSSSALFYILTRVAGKNTLVAATISLALVLPAPFLYKRLVDNARITSSKLGVMEEACGRLTSHRLLRVFTCTWKGLILCYNPIYDEFYATRVDSRDAEIRYSGPVDFICARYEHVKPQPAGVGRLYVGKTVIAHPEKSDHIMRVNGAVYVERLECDSPNDAMERALRNLFTQEVDNGGVS